MEPNGIPVRAAPPGVVGDVDVGVDDEATLLEPEPHIPDNPVVPGIPAVVDIPDVADIPVPDVAAVAGVAAPTAVPPPSKLAVDPNIPDVEVPAVEHVVPLLGIAIVPVTPVGAGLTPGDAISVAPIGIPVGETAEPVAMPSGEVTPIVGVGVAVPPTCAIATLQTKSAGSTAAIDETLIGILRFATFSLGARLSDIRLSLSGCAGSECFGHVSWLQGGRFVPPVQLNTRLCFWRRFNRAWWSAGERPPKAKNSFT
jgi:hypothetical protein